MPAESHPEHGISSEHYHYPYSVRVRRNKFTYANIVATLALVMSLAGVSYAAVSLPAHSVGSLQLRSGAVTARTLGLGLGASDVVDQGLHRITVSQACSPVDGVAPPCVPPSPAPVAKKSFRARGGGELVVAGLAGITALGSPLHSVRITATARLDGQLLPGVATITIPSEGAAEDQVAYRSFGHIGAGRHTVVLLVNVFGRIGDEIRVSPVSLSASLSPKL